MSRHLGWRLLAVLLVLGAAGWVAATRPPRLGLDLRGGTQIVLEAAERPDLPVDDDTLARTLEVLRRRVDQLGVTEPTLQRSGDRRVIVELPGVYDPREATEVIGRTAQLGFHPVLGLASPGPGAGEPAGPPEDGDGLVLADEDGGRLRLGPATLTGEAVADARAELDPQFQTRWQVAIEFQDAGGRQWAGLTGQAACQPAGDPRRRVAIVLDGQVITSPQVDPSVPCSHGISGGQTVITGDFTDDEAGDLALLIRAGALPVPVEVVEQRTVGPTLGQAAIEASWQAAAIGAALTALYMIAYYRLLGGPGLLRAAVARRAAGARLHPDPARDRRVRAGHRHGRGRQRAGVRAHAGGAPGRGRAPPLAAPRGQQGPQRHRRLQHHHPAGRRAAVLPGLGGGARLRGHPVRRGGGVAVHRPGRHPGS